MAKAFPFSNYYPLFLFSVSGSNVVGYLHTAGRGFESRLGASALSSSVGRAAVFPKGNFRLKLLSAFYFMKQVIVIRKDLGMRKGKMVAQGSHASLGSYLKAAYANQCDWMYDGQTKICVGVDSEEELLDIATQAEHADLPNYLVKDAGHTELPPGTFTAVCIGPAEESEIDKITGHLKLL